MPRAYLKVFYYFACAFLLLAGGFIYWLFYENKPPTTGSFNLNLKMLRAEARLLTGPLPTRIDVEVLSYTRAPKIAMAGGTDWGSIDLVRTAFRVHYPESHIMIEAGQTKRNALSTGAHSYDEQAWRRVVFAVDEADQILLTHGHADHAGAVIEAAYAGKPLDTVHLREGQIRTMVQAGLPEGLYYKVNSSKKPYAMSPGIVIIPALGHTPGSQMIFVRLNNGTEYLFMGDTASIKENVDQIRPRSRYVMSNIGNDDRDAVFLQLIAIKQLSESDPRLILVPGHDERVISELISLGLMRSTFLD